jgi:hypothetical protein
MHQLARTVTDQAKPLSHVSDYLAHADKCGPNHALNGSFSTDALGCTRTQLTVTLTFQNTPETCDGFCRTYGYTLCTIYAGGQGFPTCNGYREDIPGACQYGLSEIANGDIRWVVCDSSGALL